MSRAAPGIACACLGLAAAAWAATAPAPTIGDLARKNIEVFRDATVPGGTAKAMANYQQFLKLRNADPRMRAEALRRLGDLNLESGELDRMATEVTQLDILGAEAIRLYGTLLKAYPDYDRNDQVLYQLARAYQTTGQSDKALATLDQVIARYPNSRDIAEVQFRRGELLFSAKRYAEAEHAYAAVLARGSEKSPFFDQSLYKQGWAIFKQGRNEDSLGPFFSLLDRRLLDPSLPGGVRAPERLSRADRELVQDTLRVVNITFSYLDGPKSIDDYLAHRGATPYAWMIYGQLGDLYVDKQRYQDGASAYRAFVARDPVNEHSPQLSMQAIEAYRKGGFVSLMLEGKLDYVQRYGFSAAFWHGREHSAYPKVIAELKTNLHDVAEYYHASAQKSKASADYAATARWYREYLGSFPDAPESAATDYLLGEALFESHQYKEAAAEYERTAYGYAAHPARADEAGYASLVAYQKYEDTLSGAERTAWHQKATDAGVRFAHSFPQHPEAAGVLTRAAQDVYSAGDLPRAMELSEALLARQPAVDLPKQRIAWTIIGQSQFNLRAFDKAEDAFTHALAASAPADPERADITERLAEAVYKQGEAKRTEGNALGAAADFLRVHQLAPASKISATAEYDAAASLIKAEQWDRAIDVLESYRREYPKGEYVKDVGAKLAVAYTKAGRGAQAAVEFERIAGGAGEDPAVVREALLQAADLYLKAGDLPREGAMLEQFVSRFPTPVSEAMEARARLQALALHAGNAERVRYWQHEIIRADAQAGAGRTDRTKVLASEARLDLASPARDAFRAQRIVLPLKKSLAAKKQALEAALGAYKAVTEYQVASTTAAATFEMAELYRKLAEDLIGSERPKKLSAEEREEYDSLLDEQAFPFEEQAIALHEVNVKHAHDGLYNAAVQRSFSALAQLKPARYGKGELAVPEGGAAGSAAVLSAEGLQLRAEGKFSEARERYEQALAKDPKFAPAHRNLGVLLDLYLDDPAAALGEFEKYRDLSGEDKPVSGWIAELRARLGIKAPASSAAAGASP